MPAVTAAVGDAIDLGEVNIGNGVTTMRGSSDATLRLTNQQAGSPALDLRVTAGSPPLKVNSPKKVTRLNADQLDGRSANQPTRVASFYTSNAPDQNGPAASTVVTAPTDGFLVMAGSIGVYGIVPDSLRCYFAVEGSSGGRFYGHRDILVGDYARDICSTNGVAEVPAGPYEVQFGIDFWSGASLDRADLWVIFVPFDGAGAVATPSPW